MILDLLVFSAHYNPYRGYNVCSDFAKTRAQGIMSWVYLASSDRDRWRGDYQFVQFVWYWAVA